MTNEIWDLVDDLVDMRCCGYNESEYGLEIEDIENEIKNLALKIEENMKAKFEYNGSGDAKLDHDCDKAGV